MGARLSSTTPVTVMAVSSRATLWPRFWLEPNSTLKKYRVGAQMTRVARNRIGSLTAELSAWSGLCDEPITAPYSARHTTLAASMARVLAPRSTPCRISSKKRCRSRRMASMTARPRQGARRPAGESSVVVTAILSVAEYDEPLSPLVTKAVPESGAAGRALLAPQPHFRDFFIFLDKHIPFGVY